MTDRTWTYTLDARLRRALIDALDIAHANPHGMGDKDAIAELLILAREFPSDQELTDDSGDSA